MKFNTQAVLSFFHDSSEARQQLENPLSVLSELCMGAARNLLNRVNEFLRRLLMTHVSTLKMILTHVVEVSITDQHLSAHPRRANLLLMDEVKERKQKG